MELISTPLGPEHRQAVVDIFNYYVEHSHAALLETAVSYAAYDRFLAMAQG